MPAGLYQKVRMSKIQIYRSLIAAAVIAALWYLLFSRKRPSSIQLGAFSPEA